MVSFVDRTFYAVGCMACTTLKLKFCFVHRRKFANMEAGRDLKRSGSKMPHVPSFNDFCSGVESDVLDMPQLKVPKQAPPMVERSWSVDSAEGTPRCEYHKVVT